MADVVALATAGVVSPLLVGDLSQRARLAGAVVPVIVFNLSVIPVVMAVFAVYGLYRSARRRIEPGIFDDLKNLANALIVAGFVVSLIAYGVDRAFGISTLSVAKVAALFGMSLVLVPVSRALANGLFAKATGGARVIVVGTGSMAETVASHLRAHANVTFLGFVDDHPARDGELLGGLGDLARLCEEHRVDRIVVSFSRTHPERTVSVLKELAGRVAISFVPRYFELVSIRSTAEDVSGMTLLDVAPPSMSIGPRLAKRTFDLVGSSLALIVLSPLFALAAVAIKLTSPGPVFFTQERTGRNRRAFRVVKFRTMVAGAEADRTAIEELNEVDGPLFKVRDDPRVTRVGRILRKTSLDELPQLINVWKGEMSLVGPRPFVVDEAASIDGWAAKRFEARPGMTGLWQVSGRNELSYLEMCRLDYQYVASWSFWWDLRILWQTPTTVFRGRGAS